MPATLFYRWSQPYHYYYNKNGKLHRINQEKIDPDKVEKSFGKFATWLWSHEEEQGISKKLPDELGDIEGTEDTIKVEYLDSSRICNSLLFSQGFILSRKKND